jgi:ribosomal protein S18 acetylase RimI-like enzyme
MTLVRRLEPEDAALYRTIRLQALTHAPEAFGSTLEAEQRHDLETFAQRLRTNAVWGAFDSGEVVGMAGFGRQTMTKLAHKGFLWGMFVVPRARGRRVGDALADEVIAHAKNERVRVLQLSCVTTNEAARRLYERHGFVVYGIERWALKSGDEYFDEFLMALDLG